MKRIFTAILIIIALFAIFLFWWERGTRAVNPKDTKEIVFVVPKGTGVREIANKLKREKLINDPIVFFILVKRLGLDGKIQAGDFRLSPSMTTTEIANNLTHGTLDIWVTIPEGQRASEIADEFSKKIPSFENSWRDALNQNEGFLFPDTYLIPKDADAGTVISLMKNNFEQKFSSIPNAPKDQASINRIVNIASMIEREAKLSEDRPLVASVIYNRLEIDMALQIDATIQYALGYQPGQKSWWKKALANGDLKLDSPYNTYLNTGLPPTPISNPGLDVLEAAVNPAKTNYLYYVSDKTGKNHYAEILEEHNANIRKYTSN